MKELIAKNQNMVMYWRFRERVKFIKIIPTQYSQLVLSEMKKKEMKITEGDNGWFKIENQKLPDKAKQDLIEQETMKVMENGGYEDECEMIADGFRKTGFIVTVKEIEE